MARDKIVVGVDFASDGVCLAAVDRGAPSPRVTATHTYRWPRGAWGAGVVHNSTIVREGLRQAFAESTLPTADVVLGMGAEAIHRIIELPRMTADELAEQIEWEAQAHVPFDLADLHLEYRVVVGDDGGETMRVVIAGFKREVLEAHIAVAKAAQLRPHAAELETEALRRVVVASGTAGETAVIAIVRAGLDGMRVVIVKDAEAVLSRIEPATHPEQGAAEVARALDFFEATDDAGGVDQLLIAGAHAADWEAPLRATVSIPVDLWQPGRLRHDAQDHPQGRYATAIGLALAGPTTYAVGVAKPRPGLWSRLSRLVSGG